MIKKVTLLVIPLTALMGCGLLFPPSGDNTAIPPMGPYETRQPTGGVTGRILSTGSQNGLQDVHVVIKGVQSSYSDSAGKFYLHSLPPGVQTWEWTFEKAGYKAMQKEITVTIEANTTVTVPPIELEVQ
jgi:hypothetical protein